MSDLTFASGSSGEEDETSSFFSFDDQEVSPGSEQRAVRVVPDGDFGRIGNDVLVRYDEAAQAPSEEVWGDLPEVERRLEVAQCYRAILGTSFFEQPSAASSVVDQEVRGFVRGRLSALLNVRAEDRDQVQGRQFSEAEEEVLRELARLSPEQVRALLAVAGRLVGKQEPAQPPAVKRVPLPVERGVPVTGRPLARTGDAASSRPALAKESPRRLRPTGSRVPVKGEEFSEDGRRYVWDTKASMVTNAVTGEVSEKEIFYKRSVDGQVPSPEATPMPSPEQMSMVTEQHAAMSVNNGPLARSERMQRAAAMSIAEVSEA